MNGNKELIDFLRDLANMIENDKIKDEKLVEISKFFMKFKYEENDEFEELEMIKYLSLGWYIYNHLLKN